MDKRKKQPDAIKLIDLAFAIMMVTTMLGVNLFYIRPAFQAVFIAGTFLNCKHTGGFSFSVLMERVLFFMWCSASVYWALYQDISFQYLIPVLQAVFLLPALLFYTGADSGKRFQRAVQLFILCTAILCIYVFIKYPLPQVLQGKVILEDRERITARGINANQVGVCCSYSILMLLSSVKIREHRILFLLILPMLIVACMTGSRKAFMTLIIGLVLESLLIPGKRRQKVLMLLTTVLLFIAVLWAVYHIGAMYRILGKRVDALVDYVLGGTGDKSISSRSYMIEYAMELFLKRPLTGIGLHNFKSVNPYGVYAHNNYMEMLSCLGLPGFLLYYGCIFRAAAISVKNIFTKRIRAGFPQILLICLLANEYATVSYTNEVIQLVFGITLCYFVFQQKEAESDATGEMGKAKRELPAETARPHSDSCT